MSFVGHSHIEALPHMGLTQANPPTPCDISTIPACLSTDSMTLTAEAFDCACPIVVERQTVDNHRDWSDFAQPLTTDCAHIHYL